MTKTRFPNREESEAIANTMIRIDVSGPDALAIIGVIQLALRHPAMGGNPVGAMGKLFAEELARKLGEAVPITKEITQAGWNEEDE